jgi:Helix-turn-helix domain
MTKTNITQTQRILKRLRAGKTLTSAMARTQGIQRLPARIFDLREEGVRVRSVPFVNKNGHYAVRYTLASR